jgi:hypothetical protein
MTDNKSISIVWHVSDVQEIRPDLTDGQAYEVLIHAKRNHNAEMGINWDTLEFGADYLYPLTTFKNQ